MRKPPRVAWLFLCLSPVLSTPAPAQTIAESTVRSGIETRLDWVSAVGRDCKAKHAPAIKPANVAAHGIVRVVSATVTTRRVESCGEITIPAMVVFYRSAKGYEGPDSFTLIVGEGEAAQTKTYRLSVE